jgi:hypothetical protein
MHENKRDSDQEANLPVGKRKKCDRLQNKAAAKKGAGNPGILKEPDCFRGVTVEFRIQCSIVELSADLMRSAAI